MVVVVDGSQNKITSKGSWGRVKEAPTRQIHPADRRRGMGVELAGRVLIECAHRPLEGFCGPSSRFLGAIFLS